MGIEINSQGKNSIFYSFLSKNILYEKLSNTIHTGKRETLEGLQKKVEEVNYPPSFETISLKKKKNEKIEDIIFNITESCNFSCSYCIYSGNYKDERSENNSNMNFSTAKKAIDLLIDRASDPLLISFYGGEPLNNMKLIRNIIKYVKENYSNKLCAFSMTSNFYNADKYVDEIVDNKIHINISLDGPKEIHDRNRKLKNGKPTYDKIIKNLEKFEKIAPGYPEKYFHYNVTCKDSKNIPNIIDFFKKNIQFAGARISEIETKGLKEQVNNKGDEYVLDLAFDYVNQILLQNNPGILRGFFDQSLRKLIFRDKEIMPNKLSLEGCCYPGNRKLFVDTEGTFYMCERFGRRLPIGNIHEGISKSLVESYMQEFCNIRNNLCIDCWAQRLCTPCIQLSKDVKTGISEEGLSQTCDSNKSQILVALLQCINLLNDKDILEKYINTINF